MEKKNRMQKRDTCSSRDMPRSLAKSSAKRYGIYTPLYSPRNHFPRLILADISPRRRRIVREDREPLLGDRLRVIFLLALDRLQRIQVEAHAPGEIDVRRGRD